MIQATDRPAATAASTEKVKRRGGRKLGWCGYASILRSIQQRPSTTLEMAESMDTQIVAMLRVFSRLHDLQFTHVQAWVQRSKRGAHVPVWAYGPGEDAARPAGQYSRRPAQLTRAYMLPELVHAVHMLRILADEPIGKSELAERVGSQHGNVTRFINHCHRIGLVRIADWSVRMHGGRRAALYSLGSGPDAPKPRRVPRIEVARRHKRARAERERHLQLLCATAGRRAPDRGVDLREAA